MSKIRRFTTNPIQGHPPCIFETEDGELCLYSDLEATKRELEELQVALQNIAHPINYLQNLADKEGHKLSGEKAIKLSQDPNWLTGLAKNAIEASRQRAKEKQG
ncbi:MAG: hypothetical protein SH817_08485 [Leptospira sp.]|nr:hypothetical protein [Leptospira sp.]